MAFKRKPYQEKAIQYAYAKGFPNPYHPETCPPNCPKCEALRGADELTKAKFLYPKRVTKSGFRNGAHSIRCSVYDVPQGACNCGKASVR